VYTRPTVARGRLRERRWSIVWIAGLLLYWTTIPALAAPANAGAGNRTGRQLSGRLPGKPAYLWLWYADGTSPLPEDGPYCTGIKPPAFKCNYGSTLDDCQRQVLAYLEAWYADFNILFTLTRPSSGDYYTLIITSQGAWCDQETAEGGVAPFNCNDNPGMAAFAFQCGGSAHACATLIAHEHGHLVGLEHTASATDVMHETVLASSNGFDNQSSLTGQGYCVAAQNSYQQMLAALGPWTGGSKPSAFAATSSPDAGATKTGAPDAGATDRADAAPTGGSVGTPHASPDTDASVGVISGATGVPRSSPVLPDASTTPEPTQRGGCDVIAGRGRSPVSWIAMLIGAGFLAGRLRLRRASARASRARAARRP
jgi:hypothetical protein